MEKIKKYTSESRSLQKPEYFAEMIDGVEYEDAK
jgi:hypothetical protein